MKLEKLIEHLNLDRVDNAINEKDFPEQKEDKRRISIPEILLTALFVFGIYFCIAEGNLISGISILFFYVYSLYILSKDNKKEYKLFHFPKGINEEGEVTEEEVIKEMEKSNYRPATLREMLRWAIQNWDRDIAVIALGQRYKRSMEYVSALDLFTPSIRGLVTYVSLGGQWSPVCRFLGVKK